MREQTLKHLILLVGKTIAENELDSEILNRINSVGTTLAVTREKRSPYVITWQSGNLEQSLIIEDSLFKFHVRGDVPNRNLLSEDLRSSNWHAACLVWSQILGTEVKTEPNQLAPQFVEKFSHMNSVRILQYVSTVVAIVSSFLWSQETGFVLLGVSMANECLKIGDTFARRRISHFAVASLAVAASLFIPVASPAFIALLVLELVTAILIFTFRDTLIICAGLFFSLLFAFSSSEVAIDAHMSALVGFSVFSLFAIAALPFGKSGNLRRFSVLFAFGVLFLCDKGSDSALWFSAPFFLLGVFPIWFNRSKKTLNPERASVTPVVIRQFRGL